MCILWEADMISPRKATAIAERAIAYRSMRAVSYTHLTLPTN